MHFAPVKNVDISRALAKGFYRKLERCMESDVVVVGAGPSGLMCARELARLLDVPVGVAAG